MFDDEIFTRSNVLIKRIAQTVKSKIDHLIRRP